MGDDRPLREGQILSGSLLSEPMRVETVRPGGPETWVVGLVGTQTERFRSVTLSLADLKELKILEPTCSYKGNGQVLRLGLQAYALGIAYEFCKKKGYTLIYDVARRFAQPLGIHLDQWEGRIIETEKGVVRLLPVAERAKLLFGEEGASAVADRIEANPKGPIQTTLFSEDYGSVPEIRGRGRGRKAKKGSAAEVSDEKLTARREATTLDRLHAAMLLQASGRANALRALLKAEQERGPDFLRLANALSALYPKDSEEKRLLDAMLLAVPR